VVTPKTPPAGQNTGSDEGGGDKNDTTYSPEVVTKMSGGGDKNVVDNITDLNNTNAAAANSLEIKEEFLKIDPALVFTVDFYEKAAAYLSGQSLDVSYAAWILEQTRRKKPDNIRGMFVTLFFAEDMTEVFRSTRKVIPEPVSQLCPVCGTEFDSGARQCPSCGLRSDASEHDVEFHRWLKALSPAQREDYLKKSEELHLLPKKNPDDFKKVGELFDELHKEFGFPVSASG
jgi:rubrerythrin